MSWRKIVVVLVIVVAILPLRPLAAQEPPALPLAEKGPFGVGVVSLTFTDDSRDGRKLEALIWYPADAGKSSYMIPSYEAAPDTSAAPYPLVFYSHYLGANANETFGIGPHLASYGFVVASINHNDPDPMWPNTINRPLDILYVLNALADAPDTLEGIIDTDTVGVTGYSYGAFTTVMMAGAQVTPAALLDWCAANDPQGLSAPAPDYSIPGSNTSCKEFGARWEEVVAYRNQYLEPVAEDAVWPTMTDERIRAVMPMAPCRSMLFGDEGLAAATRPILIVGFSEDQTCPYAMDAVNIYEHMGADDLNMLTMVGSGHETIFDDANNKPVKMALLHFTTAFFGYELQGKADYAQYLTAESVAPYDYLAWGPVATSE